MSLTAKNPGVKSKTVVTTLILIVPICALLFSVTVFFLYIYCYLFDAFSEINNQALRTPYPGTTYT